MENERRRTERLGTEHFPAHRISVVTLNPLIPGLCCALTSLCSGSDLWLWSLRWNTSLCASGTRKVNFKGMCSTGTSKITLKIWVWGEILRSNGYSANSWLGGRCPWQGVGIRASLGSLHTQTLLGFWDKFVCTTHRHRTMHNQWTTKMLPLISLKINFKILTQPNLCLNSEVHGEKKEIHQLRVMHPAFPATAPWALPLEVPLAPSTSGEGIPAVESLSCLLGTHPAVGHGHPQPPTSPELPGAGPEAATPKKNYNILYKNYYNFKYIIYIYIIFKILF